MRPWRNGIAVQVRLPYIAAIQPREACESSPSCRASLRSPRLLEIISCVIYSLCPEEPIRGPGCSQGRFTSGY